MRMSFIKRIALSSALAAGALASTADVARAELEERKSPLDGAPAVRKRVELRSRRFEIGVGGGSSIGAAYYHSVMVNARAAFHLADWLAIGGFFGHNLTPDMKTGFTERLETVLPDRVDPAQSLRVPTDTEALGAANKVNQIMGVQGEIIPFTGKYSLFGKWFANYDFYLFGGVGFLNLKADGCSGGGGRPACAPVTGMKAGPQFGVGAHTFINNFVALGVELRDIFLRDNPAGRDTNGDIDMRGYPLVNDKDLSWEHHIFVNLNLTFFLPSTAAISD